MFVSGEGPASDADAARAAIEAARSIRDDAGTLATDEGPAVEVKVGLHWGATLTIGQVSSRGRLEVTALGDEMNEAARIESVAGPGKVLASKSLIERLDAKGAEQLAIEPDRLAYKTVAELDGSEKARRDAGTIAVAEV